MLDRPFFYSTIGELEEMYDAGFVRAGVAMAILNELEHRNTARARALAQKIAAHGLTPAGARVASDSAVLGPGHVAASLRKPEALAEGQAGYAASIEDFLAAESANILQSLGRFVADADESQVRAWRDCLTVLRSSLLDVAARLADRAREAAVILEYTVPLESRRIDVALLLPGAVVVLEFKGKTHASQADTDQAAAYARDLRAYHRLCGDVPVTCGLVLTRYSGVRVSTGGVDVIGPHDRRNYCFRQSGARAPSRR